jgi:TPR repeat protein
MIAIAALAVLPASAAAPSDLKQTQIDKTAAELRKRADTGDAGAALKLGLLISRNEVPASRFGEAVEWFAKGCEAGSPHACHNVGVSYENGRNGVAKDDAQAATYYAMAANQGFMPSQLNLGALYANDRVFPSDHVEGMKWLLLAQLAAARCADQPLCNSVLEDRHGIRARMEARLSAAERSTAREQAMAWKPKN